jgi:hypothetical protein
MPMQFTTAYAPTHDDLAEDFFGVPVLTMIPPPATPEDAEEPEQGEP